MSRVKRWVVASITGFGLIVAVNGSYAVDNRRNQNPLIRPIALPNVPQNAFSYNTNERPLLNTVRQKAIAARALRQYFSPWDNNGADSAYVKKAEQESLRLYSNYSQYYAFNFHHISASWMADLKKNMDLETFPNKNQNAIIIRDTYLRTFPTDLPIYSNPNRAGQGFPFDNIQISSFWAGHPIHVYHISADGEWALVQDNEITGYVKTTDLAYVDAGFIKKYKSGVWIAVTKDNVAVKNKNDLGLFNTHIGMILPRINGSLMAPVADENQNAVLESVKLDKNSYEKFPLSLNSKHLAKLINRILGEPYGWGGLYFYRDCSLTLKDLFFPFGVLLPRNSASQANAGKKINIKNLSDTEKTQFIEKNAKPFFTILHMPGHIVLYLGSQNNSPIIFQNKWGIKTSDDKNHYGRAVLGQAHIAPLSFGAGVKNSVTTFIKEVDTMTILG